MRPHNDAWSNSRHWPVCHRTQADAGLPAGALEERDTDDHSKDHLDLFAIGWSIGLICGLALGDLWSAFV